jgi:hypothetical protein
LYFNLLTLPTLHRLRETKTNSCVGFEINEEAQDFLKTLNGPLGIVSVAGMYRTGKSYLLNRMLLNRSGGFGVGPTINPCTKVTEIHIKDSNFLTSLPIGHLDLGKAYPRIHTRGRTHQRVSA